MFSSRFTENGFTAAGGGALAAGGVNASPSDRIFSAGRYTIANASLWPPPAIWCTSIDRLPSVSTCLSVKVWNIGAFFDCASRSGLSVRGAAHACS